MATVFGRGFARKRASQVTPAPPRPYSPQLTIRINEVAAGLNARMDGHEARTDGLETRLDALAVRMDRIEARMDAFEARLGGLESRIEVLIEAKLETRMQKAENRLVRWMFGFFVTQVGITLAAILTAAAILT